MKSIIMIIIIIIAVENFVYKCEFPVHLRNKVMIKYAFSYF